MKKIIFIILLSFTSLTWGKALQKLTVILDTYPNPDHAPLIIAEQQGFFAKHGLNVQLIIPKNPLDVSKKITQKKADVGLAFQPQFMEQVDQGLPLVRFGTLIDKPLNCLVVLKRSGIKSISDLKGKNIGAIHDKLANAMLKTMLAQKGLSEKDIRVTNVRYNLTQALMSRNVDAVAGVMRNFEVPQLDRHGQKFTAFLPEENGIPNYSELIFITHSDYKKDKRLIRFLDAIREGVAYLDAHPKETWNQFVKQFPESNNLVNREAWFATMPYFAEDPAQFDKKEWESFANFMEKNDLLKKHRPITKFAITIS